MKVIKPPRTRHCKFCDNCCMELDHHCHWIGNCIGLHNKKYFFQYGLFVLVNDAIMLPRIVHLIVGTWHTFKFSENWDILVTLFIVLSTFLSANLMCMVNFYLHVVKGHTLIEAKFFNKSNLNPYNFGIWQNLEHFFGSRFGIGWFLPISNIGDPGLSKVRFREMQERGFRKYEINRDMDRIGLTFYPITWNFCHATRK